MRRLLALGLLAFSLMTGSANAKPVYTQGLSVVGYTVDEIPPVRSDTAYPVCGEGFYENINYTWDYPQNLFGDCGWDQFMLHYTGFITLPVGVESVRFGIASDDGSDVTISGTNFGGWYDKGCSVDYSDRVELPANEPLELDAWMYENGGGTCFMLFWQFGSDNADWEIVPASAFTQFDVVAITVPISTLPETTMPTPVLTTTSQLVTTTVSPSSTFSPVSTNEIPVVVTTTVLELPSPSETTFISTSTSLVVSQVTTTEPETTTSVARTAPKTTTTTSTYTTTTIPEPTTTPTTPLAPTTSVETSKETPALLTPSAHYDSPEAILEAVSDPVALENASPAAIDAIFVAIDEQTLSDAQGMAIVKAVQHASKKVRASFEKNVNVFAGHTDTYVPLGSSVPVRSRRVIIVSSVLIAIPPPKGKKK